MECISTNEGSNVRCIFSLDFFAVAHLDGLDPRLSNFALGVAENVSNGLPKS